MKNVKKKKRKKKKVAAYNQHKFQNQLSSSTDALENEGSYFTILSLACMPFYYISVDLYVRSGAPNKRY